MSSPQKFDDERERELDYLLRSIRRFVDKYYPNSSDPVLTWHQDGEMEPNRIEITDKFGSYPRRFQNSTEIVSSPDWRVISWHGRTWKLSVNQAAVVRFLHDARGCENPYVHQRFILQEIGSESTRLVDLFKSDKGMEVWRALIEHNGDGGYRLRSKPKD